MAGVDASETERASLDLTVVIPCLNAGHVLGAQLEALAGQSWIGSWEVVVADNGSTDNSREVIAGFAGRLPALRLVDASDRPGAAHARNVGVRDAHGELILFVDADDVVGESYVGAMATALETADFVGARYEIERLNSPFLVDMWRDDPLATIPNLYGFLPHAHGGAMGVRRSVFLELGGFDEATPPFEDLDLSWRAQLAGVPLEFVPDAVYHYRLRSSLRGLLRQSWGFGTAQAAILRRYRNHLPAIETAVRVRAWRDQLLAIGRIRSRADAYGVAIDLTLRLAKLAARLRLAVGRPLEYRTLPAHIDRVGSAVR